MQSTRTINLAFIRFELFPLFWVTSFGTLSVTKSCRLCNLKSVQDIKKLYLNINQHQSISINMQSARTITRAFILFQLFPLEICLSQKKKKNKKTKTKRVHSITWKPFKISSQNFLWISINIRRLAKCKNHNCCIYPFWVIFLGSS